MAMWPPSWAIWTPLAPSPPPLHRQVRTCSPSHLSQSSRGGAANAEVKTQTCSVWTASRASRRASGAGVPSPPSFPSPVRLSRVLCPPEPRRLPAPTARAERPLLCPLGHPSESWAPVPLRAWIPDWEWVGCLRLLGAAGGPSVDPPSGVHGNKQRAIELNARE